MVSRTIIWTGQSVPGREELSIAENDKDITATSHVTGGDAELRTRWDATYTIVCDNAWRVRRVVIKESRSGRHLTLYGDGHGNWKNEAGELLENISGCIDIDFRATPFSNTFPIRRLQLRPGETASIEVAYINAPDLKINRERQIYTRMSEREWKFEQPSANFEALITVDNDGFVVDYPGLFGRVNRDEH